MQSFLPMLAADAIAIAVLVFGIYLPRHKRSDIAVAFITINVGVIAVAHLLTTVELSAGFGLGLFGVLSIIRLRSDEITQREIAYYFAALALGLIAGMSDPEFGSFLLIALVVAATAAADMMLRPTRTHVLHLDHALSDPTELTSAVLRTLGEQPRSVNVQRVDLVNDTTTVRVTV